MTDLERHRHAMTEMMKDFDRTYDRVYEPFALKKVRARILWLICRLTGVLK